MIGIETAIGIRIEIEIEIEIEINIIAEVAEIEMIEEAEENPQRKRALPNRKQNDTSSK